MRLPVVTRLDGLEPLTEGVILEEVRVEVLLLTEGVLDLVAGEELTLEGELAGELVTLAGTDAGADAGADSADLLLRLSPPPEEPPLSPLAKHGDKSSPKTTPHTTKLFFKLLNANILIPFLRPNIL